MESQMELIALWGTIEFVLQLIGAWTVGKWIASKIDGGG